MENVFFTFVRPYLSFIDNGHFFRKPFSWLYGVIGVANLLIPFYIFFQAIDNNIFRAPGKVVFVFILIWLVIAFLGWISFQIWWDRKDRVKYSSVEEDDFVATPVFSHFIQTAGEWMGTYIGVIGFWAAIIITIFLGEEGSYLSRQIGLGFIKTGFWGIIVMPISGFMIIVFTRFLSETFRALSSIANNTRRI